MCSCHAARHHDGAPHGAPAGPGTADLRHEHEVILRALAVLERVADRLAAGQPVSEAALAELVDLLRTFADKCHHGKEEDQLFPLLRARGMADTLSVFLEDHETGRGYLRTLASAAPPGERATAARRYVGLLRDHIQREDEVLFPMADEALSLDEQRELARRYEEVEVTVVGPGVHERLLATLERLEAAFPGGASEGGSQ